MNIEGSRSFQNNFVQYSFRLSVLVPDFLIQVGIDLVYIAAMQNNRNNFLSCDYPGWYLNFSVS